MLAGVSTTWYTYLEQGRDIRPSAEVLNSLARALRLDDTERTHLYLLAHQALPATAPPVGEDLDSSISGLLDALHPHPAYVTGRSWNLLAYNKAASELFRGFDDLPEDRNNLVWWMFTHPGAPATLADWEGEGRRLLARFRAAAAHYPGDPAFAALRDSVLAASGHAQAWWPNHDVLARTDGIKYFCQPEGQPPRPLRHIVLSPATTPGQKVVVYLPAPAGGLSRDPPGASYP